MDFNGKGRYCTTRAAIRFHKSTQCIGKLPFASFHELRERECKPLASRKPQESGVTPCQTALNSGCLAGWCSRPNTLLLAQMLNCTQSSMFVPMGSIKQLLRATTEVNIGHGLQPQRSSQSKTFQGECRHSLLVSGLLSIPLVNLVLLANDVGTSWHVLLSVF